MSPLAAGCRPVLSFVVSATAAVAQCATVWASMGGTPGPNGAVNASTMWDPDGSGPELPRLVLGGGFTVAGDAIAARVVGYEPSSRAWSPLGSGVDGAVRALAVLPNGNLVAAGDFTSAGGGGANRIARWDGTSWWPLGAGLDGTVRALAVLPNGDLVAGGDFAASGGSPASRLARWDGAAWSPIGGGITLTWLVGDFVAALAVASNGDLVVGGRFLGAGSVAAQNVARWDGLAWSSLGGGIGGNGEWVGALAVRPTGEIVACGEFTIAGGAAAVGVAQWNGSAWSAFGGGVPGTLWSLALEPSGNVLVGGGSVVRWDGASWARVGSGTGIAYTIAVLPNGEIVAGGLPTSGSLSNVVHVWRFDGVTWAPLSAALDYGVSALAVLPSGDLVAGGHFTVGGGLGTSRVARWNGSQWQPLGGGMNDGVKALAVLPNGDLVAAGWFTAAGGVAANRIARWNGSSWSPLGAGVDNSVWALAVMPNGDLVAAGAFTTAGGVLANRIARWDGSSWSPLGGGLTGTFWLLAAQALCVMPNGDLVAAGTFTAAGGVPANGIARWNGTTWSPLGAGVQSVQALAVLPNGQLVAGGAFVQAGGVAANCIARWNGAVWAPLGAGTSNTVLAMLPLPDGQLLVAGLFETAGGTPARRIARWNGAAWSAFGAGLGAIGAGNGEALARLPNGDVAVGGSFVTAGGVATSGVARLASTCPALAVPSGAGCAGAGGSSVLAASALPWVGATCRTRGTGLPASAIVAVVDGFGTTSLALASVFPQALPGCTLHAMPDVVELGFAAGGSFEHAFAVPSTPALAGFTLYEQLVVVELGPQLEFLAITASNALQLSVGLF